VGAEGGDRFSHVVVARLLQADNEPMRLFLDERTASIWKPQLDDGDNRQQVNPFIDWIQSTGIIDRMIGEHLEEAHVGQL
jgi:hypothetical protein